MDSKELGFPDRRRYPRYGVSYLTIIRSGDKSLTATTTDISEGGIGITLSCQFTPGEILDLQIKCSASDPERKDMNIKGEVIWCKDIGGGIYRAGIEILEISEE